MRNPLEPTPLPPLSDAERQQVEDLISACIEALENGNPAPEVALCAATPNLLPHLRQRLARLRACGLLPQPAPRMPARIGPYKVIARLGEGGMGTVYRALREDLKHNVAVKLIHAGREAGQVLERFRREQAALARMSHPAIVQIFDSGRTDDGRPYFVMELVVGTKLTAYCDAKALPLRQRIELFLQVCDAVQYAHYRGLIHRDLKPDNVLVTEGLDQKPLAKVLDFGLARAIDSGETDELSLSLDGQAVGTWEYMSPEQARGDRKHVDEQSDVYSLGVTLFELLVGSRPFDFTGASTSEKQRRIEHEEPPRPSEIVSRLAPSQVVAKARSTTRERLRRDVAGQLEWITLGAIEKDKDHRYRTPRDLADELRRYLANEPVHVRPSSRVYRLRKFVRRNRLLVGAAAAVTVALATGTVTTLLQKQRADQTAQELGVKAQELGVKVVEFDQLAAVVEYRRVVAAEVHLYPAWPRKLRMMEQWLTRCDQLLAKRKEIAETLRRLPSPIDWQPASSPTVELEYSFDGTVIERRTEFVDDSRHFLRDTLMALQTDLSSLETQLRAAVLQRRQWASGLDGLTSRHPNARYTWAEVRAAIAKADDVVASDLYAGKSIELRNEDITGLVPIGMNPVTKLWEFYELRSAWDGKQDLKDIAIPEPDAEGRFQVGDGTGIVFVLLPGGTFAMGSQKDSPDGPNYDEEAQPNWGPVHDVTVAPFFLSKYELTQGQWARLWSGDESLRQPSYFTAGESAAGEKITLANPVEQVDWAMCDSLLRLHGMVLPTEAQWEYGCRAGSTTPWLCALDELNRYANVADATAKGALPTWNCETWPDEHAVHAHVGSFLPNGFGLCDVHGNVWEWCLDEYDSYSGDPRPGDGLRWQGDHSSMRCNRGGSFNLLAAMARSALRTNDAPTVRSFSLGCRPARASRLRD